MGVLIIKNRRENICYIFEKTKAMQLFKYSYKYMNICAKVQAIYRHTHFILGYIYT